MTKRKTWWLVTTLIKENMWVLAESEQVALQRKIPDQETAETRKGHEVWHVVLKTTARKVKSWRDD